MDNLAKHLAQGFSTELQAGELLEGDRLKGPQRQWLETWDKLWQELE